MAESVLLKEYNNSSKKDEESDPMVIEVMESATDIKTLYSSSVISRN